MVGLDAVLVAPEDHRIFCLGLPFDLRVGFLQPLADFYQHAPGLRHVHAEPGLPVTKLPDGRRCNPAARPVHDAVKHLQKEKLP